MVCRRQSGWFSLEPLISLLLISLIISWVLYWQKTCFQQLQIQYRQILLVNQNSQKGMSLIGMLISLLLTSISVLTICHINLSVQNTRITFEDLLRQQRVGVMFYLAIEPYIDRSLYLGCGTAQFQKKLFPQNDLIQIYTQGDKAIPSDILKKSENNNPILYLQLLAEQQHSVSGIKPYTQTIPVKNPKDLHPGDRVVLNDCEHAQLNTIKSMSSGMLKFNNAIQEAFTPMTELRRLDRCWIYLAKSSFSYKNHKPIHTLFAACDHQPPSSLIRGIQSWKISLKEKRIIVDWISESALTATGLNWQTQLVLQNAF